MLRDEVDAFCHRLDQCVVKLMTLGGQKEGVLFVNSLKLIENYLIKFSSSQVLSFGQTPGVLLDRDGM